MPRFCSLNEIGNFPLIMGIMNITPDSFSGDGILPRRNFVEEAVSIAKKMINDGAHILDIGGESSRPGHVPISAEEEKNRVIPVISEIRKAFPTIAISVDTTKPEVAEEALNAGADIINDISGEKQSPKMRKLAAKYGCFVIGMHNNSNTEEFEKDPVLGTMYAPTENGDIIQKALADLENQVKLLIADGIDEKHIIIDPGLGFGKSVEQNLKIIKELAKFKTLGFPLLVGPSRKSFIGRVLRLPVSERLEGTAAVTAICVMNGADIVRVHDVKEISRIVQMVSAIKQA